MEKIKLEKPAALSYGCQAAIGQSVFEGADGVDLILETTCHCNLPLAKCRTS